MRRGSDPTYPRALSPGHFLDVVISEGNGFRRLSSITAPLIARYFILAECWIDPDELRCRADVSLNATAMDRDIIRTWT